MTTIEPAPPLVLQLAPVIKLTDDQLLQLCAVNRDLRIERTHFPPICPDFVLELLSPSDRLADVQAKMEEYIENGPQLGWLIDPLERKVHIYRAGAPAEVLDNPQTVSGDPLLPGFVLELAKMW